MHKLKLRKAVCTLGTLLLAGAAIAAEPGKLTVKVDQPGVKISPMFYGLMTEEINYSYDGGLYAELIRNRAFKDDAKGPAHWSLVADGDGKGTLALDGTQPLNAALPMSAKLVVEAPGKRVGVANAGYWGIPVKPATEYRVSFYAKAAAGFDGALTVSIESNDGATVQAATTIGKPGMEWKKYTATLKTGATAAPSTANRFVISTIAPGTIWLNLVSVMPPTFKERQNGMRPDLMRLLGDMKPAFLRFPGGNYLEGNTIAERFDWKKTLGPLEDRPGHPCPWGYRSSDGVGLLEFLEWCEDLEMEPLLGVFAGYALKGEVVKAGPALEPFVQEALDEIEYVTGEVTTRWGAERAKNGHPKPFKLTYVEIGNEDFFDRSGSYDGRYAQFHDAIKAKYPQLQLIASMPVKSRIPDVLDDHYYRTSKEMMRDSGHYDKASRKGSKIFVGEWASQDVDAPWANPGAKGPTPSMNSALGDAAWLTGLERNADLVVMQCYAPLLVNVNPGGRQWAVNLIGYDALGCFASPAYYVQKMFGCNRGDVVLPVEIVPQAEEPATVATKGGVGVGTWLTQAEFKDAKVTRASQVLFQGDFTAGIQGWKRAGGDWKTQDGVLVQSNLDADIRLTTGEAGWTDYTYEVKARKTGGEEGFLVLFHVEDKDNCLFLNLGGWGNTRSAIEWIRHGTKNEIGKTEPVTIETGRWYDVKIEVAGQSIKAYLDGRLIATATDKSAGKSIAPLYATASREEKSGEVIIKVVNAAAAPQRLKVILQGLSAVKNQARLEELAGEQTVMNSLAEPQKIAPKSTTIPVAQTFAHEFPAYSVSVLRISPKR
jgi:alpha-L-arabinofuranosidase